MPSIVTKRSINTPLLGVKSRNLSAASGWFLSGQGPLLADFTMARGKVGRDVDVIAPAEHARRTGLVLLSALRTFLGGSLGDVDCVVKLLGFVNAIPEFTDHPRVIDGCSHLIRAVFGCDRAATRASTHARHPLWAKDRPLDVQLIARGSEAVGGMARTLP